MSDTFEGFPIPISPERELAYIQNAEKAAQEAAYDYKVEQLSLQALAEATMLMHALEDSSDMVEKAEQFVKDNDLSAHFVDEVTRPIGDVIAEDAHRHLEKWNLAKAYEDSKTNRAALKHYELSKAKTEEERKAVLEHFTDNPEQPPTETTEE